MSSGNTKPSLPVEPSSSNTTTNIQRARVNKRLLTQHSEYSSVYSSSQSNLNINNIFNLEKDNDIENIIKSIYQEKRKYSVIGLRVEPLVKIVWDSLGLVEKRVLRDAFEKMVLEYRNAVKVDSRNIVVNINVQNVVQERGEESNVLKLKREIEKLNKELESLLAENLELKNRLRQLESRREEPKQQPQPSPQVAYLEKLEKLVNHIIDDLCRERSDFCSTKQKTRLDKIVDTIVLLYKQLKPDVNPIELKKLLV